MNISQNAPSAASLANAASGFTACALAVAGKPELGALVILVGVLLDSLDGVLARSLDADSEFGAELDSLADMLTFGAAPAVLVGSLLPSDLQQIGWAILALYPLCIAWRLARFNTRTGDEQNHGTFAGLPSTGAGSAIATAVLVQTETNAMFSPGGVLLLWLVVLLSALTVSGIPYRHASAIISRLHPRNAVLIGLAFIAGSVVWRYEYMFGALMWGYVASGPLGAAGAKLRAAHHA